MAASKEYHQAQNGLPDVFLIRLEFCKGAAVSWPSDSHGCLNIFTFCGIYEQLNMSEKILATAVLKEGGTLAEAVLEDKLEEQPLQHVLDLLKGKDFVAHVKVVEEDGTRDLQVLTTQVELVVSVMYAEEPEKRVKRKAKER